MNTNNAVSQPRIKGRSRTFRSLLVAAAGALIFTAAFVPRANAALIVYYNFEDTFPDFTSETIIGQPQMQTPVLQTTYTLTDLRDRAGIPLNVFGTVAGDTGVDPDANNHGLGLVASKDNSPSTFTFSVNATGLTQLSLSFAISALGNGFDTVSFSYSITPGHADGTFVPDGSFGLANIGPSIIVTFPVSMAVNGQPDVALRLTFTGGHSNGVDNQNTIDNIRLDAVPEPATVVGGLFGLCGLCWHQRRRLIRFARLRRA